MPKTLLRGLDLIETVDLAGPLTITEISRRLGIDISTVSRTVAACEREGWLVRQDGRIVTGPRCALLGLASPAAHAIRAAEPLVRAIAAATGITATASALVGHEAMFLTAATPDSAPAIPPGPPSRVPLYARADGLAIATQLTPAQLDTILPADPFPRPGTGPGTGSRTGLGTGLGTGPGTGLGTGFAGHAPSLVRTRRQFDEHVHRVRADGFARTSGNSFVLSCIARPWPITSPPTPRLPTAIACIGHEDEIAAHRALIEAVLIAATNPGATAHDVIHAAAPVHSPYLPKTP
jgi:hypothetical protein